MIILSPFEPKLNSVHVPNDSTLHPHFNTFYVFRPFPEFLEINKQNNLMCLNDIIFGYNCTKIYIFTFFVFSCVVQSEDSFKLTNGKSVHSDLQKILTWKYYPRIIYPYKARFTYYRHFNIQKVRLL